MMKVKSRTDVITNSSSEVYTYVTEDSVGKIMDIIDAVLLASGSDLTAKDLVEKWMADNADGPAPVIINISDGVPFYEGKNPRDCMEETVSLANEIICCSGL